MLLGIDTGGTFTDFVLFDGERLRVHKVLSTPAAPERAILQGIRDLGLPPEVPLALVHGSTVATNAVLEGKGVRTAYITNRGLGDLLTIGRQARAELYALEPSPPPEPVPPELCLETGGRLGAGGEVVEPLTEAELEALRAALVRLAPRAVAINLLFSFLDERFERAIEAVVPEGVFVSRSSALLREYKEYERGIATWLNAWVGPLVQGYLKRLTDGVPGTPVAIMQSSGTTTDAERAGSEAVHLLLSGPAGGLAGARFVAARAGRDRLLTFDMGGTSTDVALIDGDLQLTSEGQIGPYPVAVPMVDMHTIGAGGGSIARVDSGGLLQVGPESAGADPGPACYGRGGVEPTVTDANLVVGRLRPDAFLGGGMALDPEAARRAVARVAGPLGLSVEEAALGILRVANEHMARALRVMSVKRGIDARELTLVAFGGAGGLHVCALADALGMRRALAPVHAGVLSALGMLAAARGRQLSHTLNGLLAAIPEETITAELERLAVEGRTALVAEGVAVDAVRVSRSVDLRYRGQSYTINVPWEDPAAAAGAFHAAHRRLYGHRLDLPLELVNVRVALAGPEPELHLAPVPDTDAGEKMLADLYGVGGPVAVFRRERLAANLRIDGPAVLTEQVATTYVAPGWHCLVERDGNLLLARDS